MENNSQKINIPFSEAMNGIAYSGSSMKEKKKEKRNVSEAQKRDSFLPPYQASRIRRLWSSLYALLK